MMGGSASTQRSRWRRSAPGRRASRAMRNSPLPQGNGKDEETRRSKSDLRHGAVALLLVAVAGVLATSQKSAPVFEGVSPAPQPMWNATPVPRQGPMADYRRARALCATIPMPDRETCRRGVEAKYRWLREIRWTAMTAERPAKS